MAATWGTAPEATASRRTVSMAEPSILVLTLETPSAGRTARVVRGGGGPPGGLPCRQCARHHTGRDLPERSGRADPVIGSPRPGSRDDGRHPERTRTAPDDRGAGHHRPQLRLG